MRFLYLHGTNCTVSPLEFITPRSAMEPFFLHEKIKKKERSGKTAMKGFFFFVVRKSLILMR
jgi:hypothetical protein